MGARYRFPSYGVAGEVEPGLELIGEQVGVQGARPSPEASRRSRTRTTAPTPEPTELWIVTDRKTPHAASAIRGTETRPAPGVGRTTVTLVGAGDITSCSYDQDKATANLLANVSGTVFTLRDNVYPNGTTAQFQICYHPTWGTQKSRTKPSVGNHEYHTSDASGYFGARAGNPSKGYYTYKRGNWRIIVLNSNCS